jgi:hypothetical protein
MEFQWFVMVLYGYTSTLFAYCISRITASGLAAFSICAGYQVIMFVVHTSVLSMSYLLLTCPPALPHRVPFDADICKAIQDCRVSRNHPCVDENLYQLMLTVPPNRLYDVVAGACEPTGLNPSILQLSIADIS